MRGVVRLTRQLTSDLVAVAPMVHVAHSAPASLDYQLRGLSQKRSAMFPAQEIALSVAAAAGGISSTIAPDR